MIICFLKGIYRSITNFILISGHDYVEIYSNEDVQILKCERCNHISLGFKGE